MEATDLNEYAKTLYSKVGEATLLKHAVIEGGDWEPQPNMCHHNVSIWCQLKSDYEPVRGWFYFDLPGLNYVKFLAHSAVRTPKGELYDITPSNASKEYPFVHSGLCEDEYADLVDTKGYGEINYVEEDA